MKKLMMSSLFAMAMAAPAIAAPQFAVEVSQPTVNKLLSSASGIVATEGRLYAIGDDAMWFYTLGPEFNIAEKALIKRYPVKENGRIKKKVKPDFEAMAEIDYHGQTAFLLLGSGSKEKVREWGFIMTADNQLKVERSMAPLYKQLYQAAGFSGDQELNIEGLAVANDKAFILNRGNSGTNVIFSIESDKLLAYMKGESQQLNNIQVYPVTLPVLDGFEAGLSGAEYWPEANSLIYSASIEATGDAYNDGEILGSYVGVVALSDLKAGVMNDLSSQTEAIFADGKRVITKVESVGIKQSTKGKVTGVLASDNDDGTSEFFNFTLNAK
ncbi:hypothetical protein A3K86_20780 [Photobacterium jeanii]|uniref:Phytase-like domain-containing protein n=1 Tax=Photobacterium jeanii TaxID=858640 RepID=A0A178K3V3_9GAMM|nr:hypothetical protein [Photobacterium jeanii]OAN11383.1 hypothetical protein A3K86_20780 [Photobacterium jeanii]PST90904.1 hypothetical protein C9I91_09885 [Photobacterium jeanii]